MTTHIRNKRTRDTGTDIRRQVKQPRQEMRRFLPSGEPIAFSHADVFEPLLLAQMRVAASEKRLNPLLVNWYTLSLAARHNLGDSVTRLIQAMAVSCERDVIRLLAWSEAYIFDTKLSDLVSACITLDNVSLLEATLPYIKTPERAASAWQGVAQGVTHLMKTRVNGGARVLRLPIMERLHTVLSEHRDVRVSRAVAYQQLRRMSVHDSSFLHPDLKVVLDSTRCPTRNMTSLPEFVCMRSTSWSEIHELVTRLDSRGWNSRHATQVAVQLATLRETSHLNELVRCIPRKRDTYLEMAAACLAAPCLVSGPPCLASDPHYVLPASLFEPLTSPRFDTSSTVSAECAQHTLSILGALPDKVWKGLSKDCVLIRIVAYIIRNCRNRRFFCRLRTVPRLVTLVRCGDHHMSRMLDPTLRDMLLRSMSYLTSCVADAKMLHMLASTVDGIVVWWGDIATQMRMSLEDLMKAILE